MSELDVALRREFARAVRYRQHIAILLVELPPTGDVLASVRDAVRLCDSAVPASPSRVAVILPETQLSGALVVATRLASALGPSPSKGGPQSVGVATYPSPSVTDAGTLMQAVEKSLDTARSRGGGIVTPVSR